MLHLQARVHLHEVEAVWLQRSATIGDELDRAGADIADRARSLDRRLAHRGAHLWRHAWRRRLLDHLLMAALQRAIALEEMHHMPMRVAEDLHLDMARREDVFLDQHARIPEGALGLALRRIERRVEILLAIDAPHTLAAAARDRLDEHRIAGLIGLLAQEFRILALAVIARHHR